MFSVTWNRMFGSIRYRFGRCERPICQSRLSTPEPSDWWTRQRESLSASPASSESEKTRNRRIARIRNKWLIFTAASLLSICNLWSVFVPFLLPVNEMDPFFDIFHAVPKRTKNEDFTSGYCDPGYCDLLRCSGGEAEGP